MASISQEDDTESLYGVDRSGRVWYISSNVGKSSNTLDQRKSITNLRQWALLPNPTRIDIKRLSSRNGILWGISSGHQIHIYIPKTDIPIRVTAESWENERWIPINGFGTHFLPTDRPHFSSEDGLDDRSKDNFKLQSDAWEWETDWQLENTYDNQLLDKECWVYAIDFPASYEPKKSWNSCVRRRKWFRTRRFIGFDKWQPIEPVHKDHTQEPFSDVCVNTFGPTHSEISCVWVVTVLGQVYFRNNVTSANPEGTNWIHVPIEKGLEACQVAIASNGTPFVVTWTGSCLYRTGLTPSNLQGKRWVERNGPPGGLMQLSAGETTLWAITRDRKCWALKGDLQSSLAPDLMVFDWVEIPGKMKAISVNKSDKVILAVNDDDSVIYARFGITSDQKHGQGWKEAFPYTSWDSVSNTSSEVSNTSSTDQIDQPGSSDSASHVSIRPDLPPDASSALQFTDQDSDTPDGGNVSLCWVDGGCVSMFSAAGDGDLEVGPWREEILSGLQSLQVTRENFAYPNALEDTASPWSKSIAAKILQHRKSKACWVKGQLEILNNDTVVFHKDAQHTWLCSIRDILSVLKIREMALSFTLRIRNAIEAGVAELVSFKFSNEKERDDWHQSISELSTKDPEEFSLANVWLTTNQGELLECGSIKITDTPLETEVIRDSDSETHHPLITGFLPGSVLKIDITIPMGAEIFSLNLAGRSFCALHFNPRFSSACVVRNSLMHEEWGEEERDGVFPFVRGNSYGVIIECTDTHIVTTIKVQRKQFIFTYKHRVPPKYITSFHSCGDVGISGIRYDPKSGDESGQPEFVTKAIPGHFWKVETASNGFVWAIGFDSKVWVYTAGIKNKRKTETEQHNVVTDDREFYIYENQRWNPLTGFGAHGLPTDRSPWSDETGKIALEKESIKLPANTWTWVADWEIDYSVRNGVDKSGWQYAIDFPASYHSSKRFNDFVRRRRWKRVCRYTTTGPWVQVTGVKLVDLSIRMNEECEWEVLGACQDGEGVIRCGITREILAGTHWQAIPSQKSIISISNWFGQNCWAIGKDGFAYISYLLPNWQMLDRPDETPLKSIRVGPSGVWALGVNNALYRRTDILPVFPEGKDWVKVCEGVTQVSLAPDGSVWALFKQGKVFNSTLAKRVGMSHGNPHGIGWDMIAEGPWSYITLAGSRNR